MTGPIPAQRDGVAGGADPMLTLIYDTVQTGFRDVREDVARLREETVSKREFDQRHGDLAGRVGRIEAEREAERLAREASAEQQRRDEAAAAEQKRRDDQQAARDRRVDRLQKVGLAVGAGVGLLGSTGLLHFFH